MVAYSLTNIRTQDCSLAYLQNFPAVHLALFYKTTRVNCTTYCEIINSYPRVILLLVYADVIHPTASTPLIRVEINWILMPMEIRSKFVYDKIFICLD